MNKPSNSATPDEQSPDPKDPGTGLRDEVTDMIAYALWRHWKQRPRRRDLSATRRWARYATAHLELCGIKWTQKPPARFHSNTDFKDGPDRKIRDRGKESEVSG